MAALIEVAIRIAPLRAVDSCAGLSRCKPASCELISRCTSLANLAEVVTRKLPASGACSACASKSAAIHRAFPRVARIIASVGPAGKSIAQSALTNCFAAVTKRLPGPKIFSNARHASRTVCERGNRLRSADAGNLGDAVHRGRRQQLVIRSRAYDHDSLHACHLRRNYGHEKCRDQGVPATGNVAADRLDWAHDLLDRNAGLDFDSRAFWHLRLRHAANVSRCVPNGADEIASNAIARRPQFALCNPCPLPPQVCGVETLRPSEECGITAPPHVVDDSRGYTFGFGVSL
jgi:hypothetical protein